MLRGDTSSTQWTSSLSMCLSFILDPWSWHADLWTTMGSGYSMPSTHPSGMRLVRCWVKHPSMLSFGKSFSHSNGVNSASADWVDTLVSASLPSHKGVTSPWGGPIGIVSYGGQPLHYCLSFLSHTRAHHLWLGILPHIPLCSTSLSPSFSLETHQLSSALCPPASVELC